MPPYRNPYRPGGLIGNTANANRRLSRYGFEDLSQRAGRTGRLYDQYETELQDPTQAGRRFQGFFEEAGGAIAAPAMRDFNKEVSSVQANTAARFGGNASSEEQRGVYNTSDLFSRNLTEALSRLAPQAAGMGLDYISELGGAARGAEGGQDQMMQMIMQALQGSKKPNTLGQIAGFAAQALPFIL